MLETGRHLFRRAAVRASFAPIRPYFQSSRFMGTVAFNQVLIRSSISPIRSQRRYFSDPLANTERDVAKEEEPHSQAAATENSDLESEQSTQSPQVDTSTGNTSPDSGLSETTAQAIPDAEPGNNLYVGNLPFATKEDQLGEIFGKFGELVSVRIIHDQAGLSKGFGYVLFRDPAAAKEALSLHQTNIDGRFVNVLVATQQRRRPSSLNSLRVRNPPSTTLYIGNMSFEMTDRDLNSLFEKIPGVKDVRVAVDRQTGNPRGFAHADFDTIENSLAAKEMLSGKAFYGRRLKIDFGQSNVARQAPQDK